MKIYHNPRCSKSRQTLALLKEKGHDPEVIEYLKTPPTPTELKEILNKLSITPQELLRKNEADYKTHFKGKQLSDEEWITALITYPKLIERPIVINQDKAALGRPPEQVLNIL